ncbi:MAG: polymorphic toxin type 46 domain-containing protein [Myxococcota bacterium]
MEVDLRGLSALGHKKGGKPGGRGKGNTNKKPKKGAKPKAKKPSVKLRGVTKAERRLAASPGNTPAQRRARKKVVSAFLSQHGQEFDPKTKSYKPPTKKQVRDQLRGHDMSKPVKVGPPPPAPSPQHQWQRKNGFQGSYYGDKSTTPSELGISPYSRGKDGRYESKQQKPYAVDPKTPYLESTSAPVNDTWSVKGQPVPAKGGGIQRVIPDRSAAQPI